MAIAGGAAVAAMLMAGIASAATSTATVIPSTAQPGDTISVALHVFGGGFWGTDLYLVETGNVEYEAHCADMSGAVLVGSMTWTHAGLNHDGTAEFILPAVTDGSYKLFIELGNVIPPCFPAGAFTVGPAGSPDTAMERRSMPIGLWLAMSGLTFIGLAAWAAKRLPVGDGS